MTARTKSTIRAICVRSGITNAELPEEARKLLELYEDPAVAPEQKAIVKAELDLAIKKLEEKVTTRRLNEQRLALE
jgi:hypothetical protein